MRKYINRIEDISAFMKHIPLEVLQDVISRLGDHAMSATSLGVEPNQAYIQQQLRYLDKIVASNIGSE